MVASLIDCSQVRYSTRRRLWWHLVVPEHIIPEGTTACLCRRLENETKWKKKGGEKQQQNNRTQTGTLRAYTEMEASRVKYSTFKRSHSNSRSFERKKTKKPANSQQNPKCIYNNNNNHPSTQKLVIDGRFQHTHTHTAGHGSRL